MTLEILKSKIHRVTVTEARLDYIGSITIDRDGRAFTCDLKGWDVFCLPDEYDFYKSLTYRPVTEQIDSANRGVRGIYRGTFNVKRPADTFLNFETWGKGLVYVNGHPMGRIWEIGPQQTLYMPGCWLNKGENEILVVDITGPRDLTVEGLRQPLLDQLLVSRPLTHREEGETLDLTGISPVHTGAFAPGNGWQEVSLTQPVTGRYVALEAVSSHDGGDRAAIAELYLLNENGDRLSREPWTVYYADSEDVAKQNRSGDKVFDLQESTYWRTVKGTPFPHVIVIDLGAERTITGLQYLPRMESGAPNSIKDFKVYVTPTAIAK